MARTSEYVQWEEKFAGDLCTHTRTHTHTHTHLHIYKDTASFMLRWLNLRSSERPACNSHAAVDKFTYLGPQSESH